MSLSLKGHSGQVFPLSLAVLAVACVVFFVVFNSGRAVNEKINLVNAADASAKEAAKEAHRVAENFESQLSKMRLEVTAAKGDAKVALVEKTSCEEETRILRADLKKTKELLQN